MLFIALPIPTPISTCSAWRKQLEELLTHEHEANTISKLLAELPKLQETLEAEQKLWAGVPADYPSLPSDGFRPDDAILLGQRKYTEIKVPVLATFANPHKQDAPPDYDAAGRAAFGRNLLDRTTTAIKAVRAGIPSAHVVVIPNADHFVYVSNEAEVLREISAFVTTLPLTQSTGLSR